MKDDSVLILITFIFLLIFSMQLKASGRVIAVGWDQPTPARIKMELLDFENKTQFTGAVIAPTRKVTVKKHPIPASHVFADEQWQWSEFHEALKDLQSVKSTTLKQSFLLVSANPGNLDWFNDDVWISVAQHWRFLARLAKKSGLKGFFVDMEPYYKPYKQFCYVCQAKAKTISFEDYKKVVRKRSFAIMQAIIDEFPEAEIFSTRLLSDLILIPEDKESAQTYLINHDYGLVPSFIDGWMDVIKRRKNSIILADGNESLSYLFNSEEDFRGGYSLLKIKAPLLLDKKNRAYFSKIFHVSHGVYLDAYLNDAKSIWFVDRKGGSAKARIVANMFSALNNSDGLIWVYGENGYWWRGLSGKYQDWNNKIPKLSSSINMVISQSADNDMVKKNIISNKWKLSQFESSGTFSYKNDSLLLSGISNGCLVQSKDIALATDLLLGISVSVKLSKESASFPYVLVRWKDINGKWTSAQYDTLLSSLKFEEKEQRNVISGFVRPPSRASFLVFLLCLKGQKKVDDDVYYYDPVVYELDDK